MSDLRERTATSASRRTGVLGGAGPPTREARRQVARARRRRRRLKLTAVVSVLVLVGLAGAGYAVVRSLSGNIATDDAFAQLGGARAASDGPLDILLMGSDTREGANADLGGTVEGARSDTTLLLHIAGDRSSATAVSIPRDTMVQVPACPTESGGATKPVFAQFNSAYTAGGPACTIATVESITGITLDHFAVIDFSGFVGMVDALGGVDVCLAEPLEDSKADLDLPAGEQTVDGTQALGLVRARYAVGDGSDLSRIDRQQQFLSAMVRKVQSAGILLNPVRLLGFLDAATASLTTDPGLADVTELVSLGQSLRDVDNGSITFVTTPTGVYPQDSNRLIFQEEGTEAIWSALREDQPLPGTADAAEADAAAAAAAPAPAATPVKTAPDTIEVRVLNGTTTKGKATEVAAALEAQGYVVVETGNAESSDVATTVVRHSEDYDESGRTVATAAGAPTEVDSGAGSVITLVVGADYRAIAPVTVEGASGPAAAPAPSLTPTTVEQNVCVTG